MKIRNNKKQMKNQKPKTQMKISNKKEANEKLETKKKQMKNLETKRNK